MSDKADVLESQLSEESARMTLWRSFMEHPGWPEFARLLNEQMNTRQQVICLTPINSEFSAFAQEYFKGEFSGIKTALDLPQAQLDEAKREVTIANQLLENENETEARISAASASRVDDVREPFGGDPSAE